MTPLSLDAWKAWAVTDAERRGLHALKPLLEGLAVSTARLRSTAWAAAPDGPDAQPPATSEDRTDVR